MKFRSCVMAYPGSEVMSRETAKNPLTVNSRSPIIKTMTQDRKKQDQLQARIRDIAQFYNKTGRMPKIGRAHV
jgi:hypothetical protein